MPQVESDGHRRKHLAERAALTAVLDTSPDAVVSIGPDGRVSGWNPAAERLFGWSAAEAVGRDPGDLVVPGRLRVAFAEHVVGYLATGGPAPPTGPVELVGLHRHGHELRLEAALCVVGDGGRWHVHAFVRDVGRRREAKARLVSTLHEAERARDAGELALRAVVENSPSLVYVKDLDGRYLMTNEPFERAFSVRGTDLLGKDDSLLDPGTDAAWRANDLHARTGRTRVQEWSDGALGRRCYESVRFPLLDGDGRVYATGGVSLDVTAVKTANRQLARARHQADAAGSTSSAFSAFLATMSHELRTPLNAVIAMTGLLLDTRLDDAQRDFATTVQDSGEMLLSVLNDVLDYSTIASGRMQLEHRPFRLRDALESALALVTVDAHAKGLELVADIDDTGPLLVGDAARLRQMVTHLLTNAVKFTLRGEVVLTVRQRAYASRDDSLVGVQVVVRDTGIGIPADRMDRLFRSFSQVDSSTTRQHGGTGLGLAITARLAQAMGGDVTVTSERGVGSEFTAEVQLASVPDRRVADGADDGAPDGSALTGTSVLVVDDNVTSRGVLARSIEGAGATCTAVGRPGQALDLVGAGRRFDVAVIDLSLPDVDGHHLARALAALPAGRETALVLLASPQSRRAMSELPLFAAVLTKPVKKWLLVDHLTAIAHPPAPVAPVDAAQPVDLGPTAASPSAPVPLRVLLAEDNPVNQKVAQILLTRMGHHVDTVGNGVEAVQATLRQRYDVVLMDIQMPRLDGMRATEQIRAEVPASRQPFIVALTANAMAQDRRACLAAGMDDYLAKPVRAVELVAALARAGTPRHQRRRRDDAGPPSPAPVTTDDHQAAVWSRLADLAGPDPADDRVLFAQIIGSFLSRAPDDLDGLLDALGREDADAVERQAHGLKGAAANLGANGLADACEEAEARSRDDLPVFAAGLPGRLRHELAVAVQAMTAVLHRLDPASSAAS